MKINNRVDKPTNNNNLCCKNKSILFFPYTFLVGVKESIGNKEINRGKEVAEN